MADAGDLDIGGIFTPDGVLSAAERVAAGLRQISRELFDAGDEPDDFFVAWSTFTRDFLAWKGANSSWFSRVWNTTRDELLDYVQRYNTLRAEWLTIRGSSSSVGFQVKTDSIADAAERAGAAAGVALKSVAIGLAVLIAVPLGGYLVYKLVGRA